MSSGSGSGEGIRCEFDVASTFAWKTSIWLVAGEGGKGSGGEEMGSSRGTI